ncbi:MAG: sigma-70 family RNA polymerase sigma factor [Xanthomonadales bacterium]|nr:sigma-70 family RNA polymerase sigma factor [Xanthomonadales bacterium]
MDRASPERVAETAALARRLAAALARLPARQREALVLRYDQELEMREVAEILGIGEHALESLLARARRALRRALGEGP